MKTNHTPDILTPERVAELASVHGQACLSLYQSTHRNHPENQQDPIRFRQLVKSLETSLREQHAAVAVKSLLEPFVALAQEHNFWNHTMGGLAVLGTQGLFRVFLLPQSVEELAVVADSFHTKPLHQLLQSTGRYQVLALSLNKVQLFEGGRNALNTVALAADVPLTMTDTLGNGRSEPHSTVLESHSRPSGLPLMLAALPEHQHLFRKVSHNPFLMATGLMVNPESLTQDALRERAWEVAALQQQALQSARSEGRHALS
jgi:hypothetical protein